MPATSSPSYTQEDGVSLKEFMESQIAALRDHIDTRLNEINGRFAAANETHLREAVITQVMRDRCEQRHIAVDLQIGELNKFRHTIEGKASQQSVTTVTIIAIVSLLVSGAGLALKLLGG